MSGPANRRDDTLTVTRQARFPLRHDPKNIGPRQVRFPLQAVHLQLVSRSTYVQMCMACVDIAQSAILNNHTYCYHYLEKKGLQSDWKK